MAVTVAVPAEAMRGRYSFGDDRLEAGREAPDRGPAQNQIAEMAVLLSNTRGSTILGGSVLSALTIGIAIEAAFSPSVLRPGLAGVVSVSLLGCVIMCWLRAAALLLLASRPVLDQLNDHRWRTGAPLDPRVRWLSAPATAWRCLSGTRQVPQGRRRGRERQELGPEPLRRRVPRYAELTPRPSRAGRLREWRWHPRSCSCSGR